MKKNLTLWLLGVGSILVTTLGACMRSPFPSPQEAVTPNIATTVLRSPSTAVVSATIAIPIQTTTPTLSSHIPTRVPTYRSPRTLDSIPVCSGDGKVKALFKDFSLPAVIVYRNSNMSGLATIGGMPLASSQLSVPVASEMAGLGFSPDGQWLAYTLMTKQGNGENVVFLKSLEVVLVSAEGKIVQYPIEIEDFQSLFDSIGDQLAGVSEQNSYWINDQRILLTLSGQIRPPDYYPYTDLIPAYLIGQIVGVIDPFKGTWLREPLKKLEPFRLFPVGGIGFSPDMKHVLYEARRGDFYGGIVLHNLMRETDVWSDPKSRPSTSTNMSVIRWAPNGSAVVISNMPASEGNDFLILLKDNISKTIMNSTFLLCNSCQKGKYVVRNFSWSPDSRYLALVATSPKNNQLLIYDSIAEAFLYRCPIAGTDENFFSPLVWSPDNAYVAFSPPVAQTPLQVLNVKTGEIVELAQDAVVLGWSDKFPVKRP